MKRIISLVLTLVIALATLMSLTGCTDTGKKTSDSDERPAVCFVLANTANSKGLNLQSPLVQETIYSTVLNYGYMSVINADGKPSLVMDKSLDIDDRFKNASRERLEMDARSKTTNIISALQTVIADDPEVDYYEALSLARRSLASLTGYDSKTVIVIGTALSTTGVLNFNNNLLSAEPEAIVEILREREELLDFSDIRVYWQQLGDVAPPQEEMSNAQKNRLQQIYASIVEAGGGTFQLNEFIGTAAPEASAYPAVTPVKLPESTPVVFEAEELKDDNAFSEPQILGEKKVEFIADKAEYLYPDKAKESIRPIAEYLLQHETVKLLLVGTTAGDETTNYFVSLSKSRSEAVKNTLGELGVSSDRIITVGLGSDDPWHIPGLGTGESASVNRKVVLLDTRSEEAMKIMSDNKD